MSEPMTWKAPAPRTGGAWKGREKWRAVTSELRVHPGEWARFTDPRAAARAWQIRRGRLAAFAPAGAFEAVSRNEGGEIVLYIRYVGERPEREVTE